MSRRLQISRSYSKSTDRDVNIRIIKSWAALNIMQSIWKYTQSIEKKINGAGTSLVHSVTNTSWRDHLTNENYMVVYQISANQYESKG